MEEKLMQLQEKIRQDGSIREKLFALETPDQVQEFLGENGLDFTLEEIGILRDSAVKSMEKGEGGELSDEDLDNVAGGIVLKPADIGIPLRPSGPIRTRW